MSTTGHIYHKPVGNQHAPRYILLMLLAFAVSVVGTRLYLELANYPQVGNEVFHIAHALWGGLMLMVAPILLMMYVNRWIHALAALLAGAGVGLFIDEIGKFITQNNDYFFPLAAPIIYVAFLLTVFVYLYARRRKPTGARAVMYDILLDIQEILDNDLEASERVALVKRLRVISLQTERADLAALAKSLLDFIESNTLDIVPDRPRRIEQILSRLKSFENKWLPRDRLRYVLMLVLFLMVVVSVLQVAALFLLLFGRGGWTDITAQALQAANPRIVEATGLNWYIGMVALEAITGALFAGALALLWRGHGKRGVQLGSFGLIVSLTVTDVLAFYFNQFSVVVDSLLSLVVLLLLLRYQRRYLSAEQK